jgi:RNA polymerase sigma-70 factor (ECF subfamily)
MDAMAYSLAGPAVSGERPLAREFEDCLAECPRLAYRVALGVLRNPAEAEDVAQEAMLRAYRNFAQLRDRERFRPWLVRTAWRLALDARRAAQRRERHEHAAKDERAEPEAEEVAAAREFERHVAMALDALSEKLRLVMVLAAIEGYNTREVASLTGIPEGTVKTRLLRARMQMAERLRCFVKNTPTG